MGRGGLTLLDGDLQALVNGMHKLLRQWCGTAVEHAKTSEVVLGHNWVLCQQQDHGRYHVSERALELLREAAELFEVESIHDDRPVSGIDIVQ